MATRKTKTNEDSIGGNVANLVVYQAARRPAAPALILPDRVIEFRRLAAAMYAVAAALRSAGVQPGQMIGVSMGQTPLHLFTILALAHIGAVSVPLHPMIPAARRQLAAQRYGVSAIVSGRPDMLLDGLPFISLAHVGHGAAPSPGYDAKPDTPFRIALSSGTSGDPKGVMFTHGYMLDRMAKANPGCTSQSRLLPMDLNFPVGFAGPLGLLSIGGAVILTAGNTLLELANAARLHAASHWLLSPAQAEDISHLLEIDDIHFPAMQHLRIVGSTPSKRLLETLTRRFTPNVFVPYGSTEMGLVSMATPEILDRHPDSCGKLFPWAQAEIVDDKGKVMAPGEAGSLRLRLEGMVSGYHLAPEHTAERFRDGWYYPGDRARIDEEGLMFIEGREDDVINLNGLKVNPRDIENVLLSHTSVSDAAAFALVDEQGNQALAAAYIAAAPVNSGELHAYATERLGVLSPRHLYQVASFPRNANGKLLRDQLSSQLRLMHPVVVAGGPH